MNETEERLKSIVPQGKAALLVIDMQNDFVSPKGKMAEFGFDLQEVGKIIRPIKKLLDTARSLKLPIIHTRMINDLQQNPLSWYAFWGEPVVALPGSWGAEFVAELKPAPSELVITKYTYGAFMGTNLDTVLRRKGVQTILVAGTGPNICAGDTMHQAFASGYHVAAVSDCLASFSRKGPEFNARLMEVGLYIVENHFGYVVNSDKLIQLLR